MAEGDGGYLDCIRELYNDVETWPLHRTELVDQAPTSAEIASFFSTPPFNMPAKIAVIYWR